MNADTERLPKGELTDVERALLTNAGYTELQICAVEDSILGILDSEGESYLRGTRLMEPVPGAPHPLVVLRALWSERLATVPDNDDPSDDPDDPSTQALDDFSHADQLREADGLPGVLREYADFFVCVEDTNFAYRDWRQIGYAFFEMELTPLPTKSEIETACGPLGLNLPSLVVDGNRYFDFAFIGRSTAEKRRRSRELKQAREEVHRYLIGDRWERWQ